MTITHEKQQILKAIAVPNRPAGQLLSPARFAELTAQGKRDYLRDLSEREFWAQAEICGAAKGRTASAMIAEWAGVL